MLYLLGPITRKRSLLLVLRNQKRISYVFSSTRTDRMYFLCRMYGVWCTEPARPVVSPGAEWYPESSFSYASLAKNAPGNNRRKVVRIATSQSYYFRTCEQSIIKYPHPHRIIIIIVYAKTKILSNQIGIRNCNCFWSREVFVLSFFSIRAPSEHWHTILTFRIPAMYYN